MQTLPPEFIKLIDSYGFEPFGGLADTLCGTVPAVSVRLNPDKAVFTEAAERGSAVGWCPLGRYLDSRPVFAFDAAWHGGDYYVQDASSMAVGAAVEFLVRQYFTADDGTVAPGVYLDACAAPGGKTIAALDALPHSWFVLANEYDFRRANILAENLSKRGLMNHAVSRGDTSRIGRLHGLFDIIAADVPCSGEGMMRKDPQATAQWTPALTMECAALQREIVGNLWDALRPGGFLIYSTCTFNRRENEDNIEFFVREYGAEGVSLPAGLFPDAAGGIECALPCLRFIPGRTRGEGLFMCVLRKPDGETCGKRQGGKKNRNARPAARPAGKILRFAQRHLALEPDAYELSECCGTAISFVPAGRGALVKTLCDTLDMVSCGTALAEPKGRELSPCHDLAQSVYLRRDSFPEAALPYHAAMRYLRGEALAGLPDGLPTGFITVSCDGSLLGFAKNIGRRANNLYPAGRRLHSEAPETPPTPITTNISQRR